MDASVISLIIKSFNIEHDDYASNIIDRSWPRGLDCEVFRADLLAQLDDMNLTEEYNEHVTLYMRAHPNLFRLKSVRSEKIYYPSQRLCIDEESDLVFARALFSMLDNKSDMHCIDKLISVIESNPQLKQLNSQVKQTKIFNIEY